MFLNRWVATPFWVTKTLFIVVMDKYMGHQIVLYFVLWVANYQMLRTTALNGKLLCHFFTKRSNWKRRRRQIVDKKCKQTLNEEGGTRFWRPSSLSILLFVAVVVVVLKAELELDTKKCCVDVRIGSMVSLNFENTEF